MFADNIIYLYCITNVWNIFLAGSAVADALSGKAGHAARYSIQPESGSVADCIRLHHYVLLSGDV